MVSIVLPVYNGAESLDKAIKSIVEQSYHNFELIIVNDCSTDNSYDIISEWCKKDSRISCINNETNQKLPMSLNIGFSHAQGQYYTWTSHDNMYHEKAIEVMVDSLDNNKDIGMVYCDFVIIDEKDNEIEICHQDGPETLAWKNPIGACFMYRRDIAELIGGYDKELFLAEDYEYWLRIWKKSGILHIPKVLYFYRKHKKSLTETRKKDIGHKTVEVWMKHWEHIFSNINGIKNKLQFCYKMVEMEYKESKGYVFGKIATRYPLFVPYSFYIKFKAMVSALLEKK